MESHSSLNNTGDRDDEPCYRTLTCNPGDIICAGSDEEETAEETRRKRLRYEAQARRYMRGHRPILLTTSLRGPFSKESGWVNPWARPPRRKQNQIRPQPASEVAASSRSKLAEKVSSSHGFGYVNPEAVLAWQAKVGALECGVDEQGHTHGEHEPMISTPCDEDNKVSGAADSEPRPEDSMRNHYTKTPHVGNDVDLTTRATKRAADSQWLKGSYVSKRARWDGPALSSPTPGLDYLNLRGREWRPASARLAEQGTMNADRLKSATHALGSNLERPQETPVIGNALRDNKLFSAQIGSHRNSYPAMKGTLFSCSMQMTSLPQLLDKHEEIDELQENSQESRTSSQKSSGKKSRRNLDKSLGPSSSDLEQDDLIVITPRSKPFSTPAITSTNSHVKNGSLSLPKLPRPSAHFNSDFREDSFVSEVAPSSRNLENFRFKKRKRRTKSAENEELDGGQGEIVVSAEEDPPKDDDNPPSIVSMPLQITSIEAPENITPEIEVASEDAYSPSTKSIPTNLSSSRPKNHSDVDEAKDNKGVQLGSAFKSPLHAQHNTMLPSEQQRYYSSDGGPSLDNGEADISFNVGEMSFLRAVLRAGNSRSNTPFDKTDLALKPIETSKLFLNKEENGQHSNGFLKSVSNVPQEPTPSSLYERIPHTSLSPQQIAISSQDSDEEDSQPLDEFFASRNHISQQHLSGSSSQKVPQVLLPSQRSKFPQNGKKKDRQISKQPFKSSNSSSKHPAQSSPHSLLTQVAIPSHGSRISRDPNDVSTQSYNTTPVKSQRNGPRPHAREIVKPPSVEDKGASLADDEPITDAEQDEMDKIQMELSQECSSSTPESASRSDDDDDLDQIGQANVELQNTTPSANPKSQDPCRMFTEQVKHPRGGLESEHEKEIVLPGAEELIIGTGTGKAKPEQPREISPDLVSEDDAGEINAHVESNEANQKINDKGAEEASEASWEGCGPQSPWAIEHIVSAPLHAPRDANFAKPFGSLDLEDEPVIVVDDAPEEDHDLTTSSEWQHIERPQTPDNNCITPFRDLMTPTDAPNWTEMDLPETLTSTQLLIHAATRNPWGSSLKKPTSMKTKKQTGKRVSFDGLSSQHSVDEPPLQVKFGPVPHPSPTMVKEEDIFSNGTTNGMKFEKHFNRKFTRILPENVASPLNSSPALGAQAEAFIAADQETSIDQLPNTATALQTPTRHLKPRCQPNSDIVWRHQEETVIPGSEESQPVRKSLAGFDMEDALGEMGNFLEDWSVDAELKQARVSSPKKREESNSYRRRRLFGIV